MKKFKGLPPSGKCEAATALEDIMSYSQRLVEQEGLIRGKYLLTRHFLRKLFKGGSSIHATFDFRDVDPVIIEKLIGEHGKDLEVIAAWILSYGHYKTDKIIAAARNLEKVSKAKPAEKYWRAIGGYRGQQTAGLTVQQRRLRAPIVSLLGKPAFVGQKLVIKQPEILSFSMSEKSARDYGSIVVSAEGSELNGRVFHITREIEFAVFVLRFMDLNFARASTMATEEDPEGIVELFKEALFNTWAPDTQEALYLPDNKTITLTIESVR